MKLHVDRFRVRHGDRSALARLPPDYASRFNGPDAALQHASEDTGHLVEHQERLYAQGEHAILLIFQGMDASGKDSAIKHVMSGANPRGTDVHSFKRPSPEDLSHGYLWRASTVMPARGRIGIFNRSYYEDVLVVRVHPELLAAQHLPSDRITPNIWRERFEDITAFEQYAWRTGTEIRKFFLHVSRAEQRRRFLERLDDPAKNWKFSLGDLPERAKWDEYMRAYREALAATSYEHAPWYVIPADHKWFARALISHIIVKTLDDLALAFPRLSRDQRAELAQARRRLARGT